ncbi:MAG: hypothetical protein ABI831_25810 [Betaproteobacteria bacterium]
MREDQATGLRRLFAPRAPRTFGVVGAGATPLALDLAHSLARAGQRVLMLDRTHGEAGVALGLRARYELRHVLQGERELRRVVLNTSGGFDLLPAARGLEDVDGNDNDATESWRRLAAAMTVYDVVLCNGAPWDAATSAGWVLALTPTSASMRAAYAELKRLARKQGARRCRVVVDAATERAALEAFSSVAETAQRFLGVQLELGGAIIATPATPAKPGATRTDGIAVSSRAAALNRFAEALVADGNMAAPRAVNH